jgi:hypothetical protein
MGKRPEQKSFADIVREVEAVPPAALPAGLSAGVLTDQEGRQYERVDEDITPERALELASAGAIVVHDPCGCGGGCGFDWYTAQDVKDMAVSGPPAIQKGKRRRGTISEWRAESGAALLLAEDAVRWANRMG